MESFKEGKCFIRRNTTVPTGVLHKGVKIDGNVGIFDQMLEVRVSTIFPHDSLPMKLFLEFLKFSLSQILYNVKPGFSDQDGESISLSFVQFYVICLFDKDGDILRRNHPLVKGCVEGNLGIFSVSFVEFV